MGVTKLIFGAGLWTKDQGANSASDVKPWVDALVESKHLVGEIDTSALYAQSEEYLGQLDVGSQFAIGTKLPGKLGPLANREMIIVQARASLSKLGVEKVRCHISPDTSAIFPGFAHGLTFLDMSISCSFRGRWEKSGFLGQCYHLMYNRPSALEAMGKWHEIARAEGISAVEMAFRWVVHNSALDGSLGDGVVIGASTTEQWKDNLAAIQKGPLSSEATAKIDALWGPLKPDSYYCNLDVVLEIMAGAAKQPASEQ